MKRCTKCGEEKALTEFNRCARGRKGLQSWCKNCTKINMRNYYKANREKICKRIREQRKENPERARSYNRKWYRENRLSQVLAASRSIAKRNNHAPCSATIEELKETFTGLCHACGVPEMECTHKLHMDHCHETGRFRGWLCAECNKALGTLRDSPDRILALAEYIERATVLTPNP